MGFDRQAPADVATSLCLLSVHSTHISSARLQHGSSSYPHTSSSLLLSSAAMISRSRYSGRFITVDAGRAKLALPVVASTHAQPGSHTCRTHIVPRINRCPHHWRKPQHQSYLRACTCPRQCTSHPRPAGPFQHHPLRYTLRFPLLVASVSLSNSSDVRNPARSNMLPSFADSSTRPLLKTLRLQTPTQDKASA